MLQLEMRSEHIAGLISVSEGAGEAARSESFSGYVELIAALESARARALPVADPKRADERLGGSDERLV